MAWTKEAAIRNSAVKAQKNTTQAKKNNIAPQPVLKQMDQIVNNVVSDNNNVIANNSPESFIRQLSNENTAQTFAFNAEEAQKARDFSEYMSNTSHQREVEDLKRAGLNPVLSANGGATAYSASSASGSADNSAVGVLGSLYATKLNNQNAEKIANYQAEVNKYIAKLNTSNSKQIAKIETQNAKEIAKINAQASKYASDNASSASRYASDNSLFGSKYSADTSYASSKYGIDKSKYGLIDQFVSGMLGNSNGSNAGNAGKLSTAVAKILADHSPRNPKNKYKKK